MKASVVGSMVLAFAGMALALPQATGTAQPPATTTAPTPKPSPTQPGLIDTCTTFYMAVLGDTCIGIVNKNNGAFTLQDFYDWNPAVGNDCLGLWANTYYCIGAPRGSTTTSSTTTTSAGNGIQTPLPTQPGMVDNCDTFYFVEPNDTCAKIAAANFVSVDDIRTWNPSVGPQCTSIWANAYVCVRVLGYQPPRVPTCNTATDTKTWGDNLPYAVQAAADFCTASAGLFTVGQRKTGCFNAALGVNKFSFEITNNWGVNRGATPLRCQDLMSIPLNSCARGGLGQIQGWQVSASVTAGRC
ncbi:hypothetical protein B0I35DRAFT_414543 [Stachybotrys elegans]|uniref:LysM domain-containing protein n=1 Tax=Stachybotrys elegans TaxID=80388 RepID=A0A8K0SHW0_9HYPO|nr:hypothetical protein B0I35DRAFT_414543 [Stachybotrys elegans]